MKRPDIAAIEVHLRSVSSFPWEHVPGHNDIESANGGCVCWVQEHGSVRTIQQTGEEYSHADAEFIAKGPQYVADLIAWIKKLENPVPKMKLPSCNCSRCRGVDPEPWEYAEVDEDLY